MAANASRRGQWRPGGSFGFNLWKRLAVARLPSDPESVESAESAVSVMLSARMPLTDVFGAGKSPNRYQRFIWPKSSSEVGFGSFRLRGHPIGLVAAFFQRSLKEDVRISWKFSKQTQNAAAS